VRETIFKGQITRDDFEDAISNSPYSLDVTAEHIQITTDTMVRTGVGRLARPPLARDWVRTDMLDAAKKSVAMK
jgi:NitT/TauT family transport system substrate-binding protein